MMDIGLSARLVVLPKSCFIQRSGTGAVGARRSGVGWGIGVLAIDAFDSRDIGDTSSHFFWHCSGFHLSSTPKSSICQNISQGSDVQLGLKVKKEVRRRSPATMIGVTAG